MAREFIDLSKVFDKKNNQDAEDQIREEGTPEEEYMDSSEWNSVGEAINQIEEAINDIDDTTVKGIKQGTQTYYPGNDGILVLPGADTAVNIYAKENVENPIVSVDGKFKLNLIVTSNTGSTDTFETVRVEVHTSVIGSSNFTKRGEFTIQAVAHDSTLYKEEDLTKYISIGSQQVYLIATGLRTGVTGYLLIPNVTITNLNISSAIEWSNAMTGSIRLAYYIEGAINKNLYVTIDGKTVVNGRALGTATSIETPYTTDLEFSSPTYCTHGTHEIEAWLVASDDVTKTTKHVKSQVFFNADPTNTTPYVVINNISTEAQPYVDTRLFDYCVFAGGGVRTVPIIIKIVSSDNSVEYLVHDVGNIEVGVVQEYNNSIDIVSTEDLIYAYMKIFTNVTGTLKEEKSVLLTLDNSNNFAPTAMDSTGFLLNPKVRSNTETNPQKIINSNGNTEVESIWTGFSMGATDGWVDGYLLVPAGRNLLIKTNPLSGLIETSSTESLTMEFDVEVTNLRSQEAEEEPILEICSNGSDGKPVGFQMLPMKAYLLTQNKRVKTAQDVGWQESERVRVAVNIVYNLAQSGQNYARIFINGCINREFNYINDSFCIQNAVEGIRIGSSSSDIKVYSIKVFKQALSSANIMQNYKSSLSDTTEKLEFQRRNDILGDTGKIDFDQCKNKGYNTLRFIADSKTKNLIANYSNQGNNCTTGTIELLVRNSDGTLNKKYCQRITHVKQKGQGTSSMTYWKWNLTFSAVSSEDTTKLSKRYTLDDNDEWVLDDTVEGADCYILWPNGTRSDIKGIKNVLKINWASSMQSHKMGAVNAYTDLYRLCVGNSGICSVSGFENVRQSVVQLPFLFFVHKDEEDASTCEFYCTGTFGPGKGDKPTFGTKAKSPLYKVGGNSTSLYTMLEGSANGRPLTERKMPWIKEEIHYYFNASNDDDPLNECFIYNGEAQLDFDAGPKFTVIEGEVEYDVPNGFTRLNGTNKWQETSDTEFSSSDPYRTNGNTIKYWRRAYNFDYLHNHLINYIQGTLTTLKRRTDLDTNYQYWVTSAEGSSRAYDLYRWNYELKEWVNAGTELDPSQEDGYAVFNIKEQFDEIAEKYGLSISAQDPASMNQAFINARIIDYAGNPSDVATTSGIQHYTSGSPQFYNEVDCDFSQAFRKIFALKDNWCKNTYEYLTPDGLICEANDDDDTMADIDNVGASTTPYYVEEHDRCNADGTWNEDGTNTYWNSDTNVRYVMREQSRDDSIRAMCQSILNEMSKKSGSVYEFIQEYFFSTQEYFPVVVYNECAKLLYEEAKTAMANNQYTNAVDPLTQSLGNHLEVQKQWWKRRAVYMASYARSTDWINSTGTGSFSFRTSAPSSTYRLTLTAFQWLYPAARVEGGALPSLHRMKAGETYTLDPFTANTQDINVFLYGADYFTSFGDLSGMNIKGTSTGPLSVSGARLTEFIADGADGHFCPAAVDFYTPRLQTLKLTNTPTILGAPNLSGCNILEYVNMRGCDGVSNIVFPETDSLNYIFMPKNTSSVNLKSTPNVSTFEIEGWNNITSISISNVSNLVYNTILDLVKSLIY